MTRKATRQELLEIARSWKGARFQHQGTSKELGADCAGFVEGVFFEAGHAEVLEVVRNYRRREDGSVLQRMLGDKMDYVGGNTDQVPRQPTDLSVALPADVLAFCDENLRHTDIPRHLGFYVGQRGDGVHYALHMGSETHGIVEHRLDVRWLKRIHSIWRVRNIED